VTDKAEVADAFGARFNGGARRAPPSGLSTTASDEASTSFNIGWPGVDINRMSQIAVSICELGPDGPFIGSAHMQILNVAPQSDSTVFVRYNVAWSGNPLTYRFNFIIVN
jgi:hypothetical protein